MLLRKNVLYNSDRRGLLQLQNKVLLNTAMQNEIFYFFSLEFFRFLFCEKCVRDIPGDAVTIDAGSPSER